MAAAPKRNFVKWWAAAATGLGAASVIGCCAAVSAKGIPDDLPLAHADVVVVGAGISGMSCAAALARKGRRVIVLEASYHVGGRIRSVNENEFAAFGGDSDSDEVVPWSHRKWLRVHRPRLLDVPDDDTSPPPAAIAHRFGSESYNFEIGAEFLHGPNSDLAKELKQQGLACEEIFTWAHGDGGPGDAPSPAGRIGMYWDGIKKTLSRYDQIDDDHRAAVEALDGLATLADTDKETRSLGEYLCARGVPPSGIAFAEAGYANTVGGTLDRISLSGMCRAERAWLRDGHGDYRVRHNKTLSSVFEKLGKGVDVRLKSPVRAISESSDGHHVIVRTDNLVIAAPAVVVTASVAALQQRIIAFDPMLSPAFDDALSSFRCEPALKMCAKFKRRLWPAELDGVICSASFAPEIWFDTTGDGEGQRHYVTAFFTSDEARRVAKMSTVPAFRSFREQLAQMFTLTPEEIRESYCGGIIIDWAAVPWIWGGYTPPSTSESAAARGMLARPHWRGKLMFAGEATDPDGYMTAHAAFATGLRAARAADVAVNNCAECRRAHFRGI